MQRLNINRIYERMSNRVSTVTASVTDFFPLSKDVARVVITSNVKDAAPEEYRAALASALGNNAVPIAGSFRWVPSSGNPAAVGFVKANSERRPYEYAGQKKLVSLASNMLMDAADNSLWEIQSSGDNKVLVRRGNDDLSTILQTAKLHVQSAPRLIQMASVVGGERQFISFVDTATAEVRYGFVLSETASDDRIDVVPVAEFSTDSEATNEGVQTLPGVDDPIVIETACVIEVATLQEPVTAGKADPKYGNGKQGMIDYYRDLYSYSPEYFDLVKKTIDSHAAL